MLNKNLKETVAMAEFKLCRKGRMKERFVSFLIPLQIKVEWSYLT